MAALPVSVFYLCDTFTGAIINELPLVADSVLSYVMAREDSTTFTLPLTDKACPSDWQTQIQPGKTMIVQTLDGAPLQGWAVVDDLVVGGPTVQIGASTLEHCPTETNVPDVVQPVGSLYDNAQRAALVAAPLVPRFGFSIEWAATGAALDVEYDNAEDRSIFDALEDMRTSEQSIEWRIKLRWHDDTHRAFDKVLQIAKQIGTSRPDAVFDLDAAGKGNIDSYTRTTSYAPGKGATLLQGFSEGTGPSRDSSGEVRATDLIANGWPVWEFRETITGLADGYTDADLLAATQAKLANLRLGRTTWVVVGNENAPRPGRDFEPGDTIGIDVDPQSMEVTYPDGTTGVVWIDATGGTAQLRVIGYQYDSASGRVTPTFWEDADG
jgi:hypothetical protein